MNLARQLDIEHRVWFVGERENVEDYLAAADLFVLPSTSESFGNALVEAMASGLPCIALRPEFGRINTGVAEHIEEGVTGFLVDADDPADLAGKIALLAGDPERARQMGLAGRRAAQQKFDWNKIAARLLEIVAEVRQARRPSRRNRR
jgi:glycosyltransferase involved in cell wall biosynthesis